MIASIAVSLHSARAVFSTACALRTFDWSSVTNSSLLIMLVLTNISELADCAD